MKKIFLVLVAMTSLAATGSVLADDTNSNNAQTLGSGLNPSSANGGDMLNPSSANADTQDMGSSPAGGQITPDNATGDDDY